MLTHPAHFCSAKTERLRRALSSVIFQGLKDVHRAARSARQAAIKRAGRGPARPPLSSPSSSPAAAIAAAKAVDPARLALRLVGDLDLPVNTGLGDEERSRFLRSTAREGGGDDREDGGGDREGGGGDRSGKGVPTPPDPPAGLGLAEEARVAGSRAVVDAVALLLVRARPLAVELAGLRLHPLGGTKGGGGTKEGGETGAAGAAGAALPRGRDGNDDGDGDACDALSLPGTDGAGSDDTNDDSSGDGGSLIVRRASDATGLMGAALERRLAIEGRTEELRRVQMARRRRERREAAEGRARGGDDGGGDDGGDAPAPSTEPKLTRRRKAVPGAGSAAAADADVNSPPKNRLGQRARRWLAARQHGADAHHIRAKREARGETATDLDGPNRRAGGGAVGGDCQGGGRGGRGGGGRGGRGGGGRGGRGEGPHTTAPRRSAVAGPVSAAPLQRPSYGDVHPSLAARLQARARVPPVGGGGGGGGAGAGGKRIVFAD